MKSLINFLTESTLNETVHDNLGINDAIDISLIDDWVKRYNEQPEVCIRHTNDNILYELKPRKKTDAHRINTVVVIEDNNIDIVDDSLLENGYIPDYIHIYAHKNNSNPYTINVYNDNLKSLRGINFNNKDTYVINLCHAQAFCDWNIISKLYINLNILDPDHSPKDFRGINVQMLTICNLTAKNISIIDKIKGCTLYHVGLYGDIRNNEDTLSCFLENNIIKTSRLALNISNLMVNNFDFLYSINPKSKFAITYAMPKGDWVNDPDSFKNMFKPFKNTHILHGYYNPSSWSLSLSELYRYCVEYEDKIGVGFINSIMKKLNIN